MANIDVQKKKSNPLLWIVLLLLALAVIGYLVWSNSNNTSDTKNSAVTTDTTQH